MLEVVEDSELKLDFCGSYSLQQLFQPHGIALSVPRQLASSCSELASKRKSGSQAPRGVKVVVEGPN